MIIALWCWIEVKTTSSYVLPNVAKVFPYFSRQGNTPPFGGKFQNLLLKIGNER